MKFLFEIIIWTLILYEIFEIARKITYRFLGLDDKDRTTNILQKIENDKKCVSQEKH